MIKGTKLKPSGRILKNQPKVDGDLKEQITKGANLKKAKSFQDKSSPVLVAEIGKLIV